MFFDSLFWQGKTYRHELAKQIFREQRVREKLLFSDQRRTNCLDDGIKRLSEFCGGSQTNRLEFKSNLALRSEVLDSLFHDLAQIRVRKTIRHLYRLGSELRKFFI